MCAVRGRKLSSSERSNTILVMFAEVQSDPQIEHNSTVTVQEGLWGVNPALLAPHLGFWLKRKAFAMTSGTGQQELGSFLYKPGAGGNPNTGKGSALTRGSVNAERYGGANPGGVWSGSWMGEDRGMEVGLWAILYFPIEGKTYDRVKVLGLRYGAKAKHVASWVPRGRRVGGTMFSPGITGWQESGERWDWWHPALVQQWAWLMSSPV